MSKVNSKPPRLVVYEYFPRWSGRDKEKSNLSFSFSKTNETNVISYTLYRLERESRKLGKKRRSFFFFSISRTNRENRRFPSNADVEFRDTNHEADNARLEFGISRKIGTAPLSLYPRVQLYTLNPPYKYHASLDRFPKDWLAVSFVGIAHRFASIYQGMKPSPIPYQTIRHPRSL